MTITPSRLLTRLDADIAAATDPVAADCLRAERAAYLARQGHLGEAAKELEAIRQRHARSTHPEITSWVCLAEGILAHFTDLGQEANDRIKRAYAISTFADLRKVRALGAAWLSHVEYLSYYKIDDFIEHAKIALELGSIDVPAAVLRANMVIGMAFHLAGSQKLALDRYEIARQLAIEMGDSHTVSALIHNSAWLWASGLRNPQLEVSAESGGFRHAFMIAQSSSNFDELLGSTGLMSLQPLLRAFLGTIRGQFREARDAYDSILNSSEPQALGNMKTVFVADLAWCEAMLGEKHRAKKIAETLDESLIARQHPDDRGMTCERLSELYNELGCRQESDAFRCLSSEAWAEHRENQKRILDSLHRAGLHQLGNTNVEAGK